jgi:hypothetical protein
VSAGIVDGPAKAPVVRTLPKTPLATALWLVCILACFVMIFASTIAGLALMVTALVLYTAGRVVGWRCLRPARRQAWLKWVALADLP